jgi:hypothetical protein
MHAWRTEENVVSDISQERQYPWRIMVSSTMRDLPQERHITQETIRALGLTPWWAEEPPSEFTGSAYDLSCAMAQRCDLYLLVLGARYGSRPEGMPAGDTRSVTHLEFDLARAASPRKVRVFIPDDLEALATSDEHRAFIQQVLHFANGYVSRVYHRGELDSLREQVRQALEQWLDPAGRDAYVNAVRDEYAVFRNPVTGAEGSYDTTVLLKLRAEESSHSGGRWDATMEKQDLWLRARQHSIRSSAAPMPLPAPSRADASVGASPEPLIAPISDFLEAFAHCVVLGDAGAGKSTILRRLAADSARTYLRAGNAAAHVPVLVRATDVGRMQAQHSAPSLAETLGLIKEQEMRVAGLKPVVRAVVAEAVARGEALVLIDGLDEASADEQRRVLVLLGQIGANRALIASRPAAYGGELSGWRVCEVQRLDRRQRRTLIAHVFTSLSGASDVPKTHALPAPEPDVLEEELDARPDLFVWAGNPLLLTLIAAQFLRERRLPDNRARIYEFAIEDLQTQRPATALRRITREELDHLLQLLALRMAEAAVRATRAEEVAIRFLPVELQALAAASLTDANMPGWDTQGADDSRHEADNQALRDLAVALASETLMRSGALQSQPDGGWEFVHLSFRDYLTATALARMPRARLRRIASARRLSAQWTNIFELLVSRLDGEMRAEDATALINELINADGRRVAALAGRDPCHLALRLATRCQLARPSALASGPPMARLRRKWRPLWRAEVARARRGQEFLVIGSFIATHSLFDGFWWEPLWYMLLGGFLSPWFLIRSASTMRRGWGVTWRIGCPNNRMPGVRMAQDRAWVILVGGLLPLLTIVLAGLLLPLAIVLAGLLLPLTILAALATNILESVPRVRAQPSRERRATPSPLAYEAALALGPRILRRRWFVQPDRVAPLVVGTLVGLAWIVLRGQGVLLLSHVVGSSQLLRRERAVLPATALTVLLFLVAARLLMRTLVTRDIELRFVLSTAAVVRAVGAPALPQLIRFMNAPDPALRRAAVEMVGALGSRAAQRTLPLLLPLLADMDAQTRQAAVRACGLIGRTAAPALLPLLEGPSIDGRVAAIEALGLLGPPAADLVIPALAPKLHDSIAQIRETAVRAIEAVGVADVDAALRHLLPCLKDTDTDVLKAARQAVRALGPDTLPALLPMGEALRDDATRRKQARPWKTILPDVRRETHVALRHERNGGNIEAIYEIGSLPAAEARAALPTAYRLLRHPSSDVRQAAGAAIQAQIHVATVTHLRRVRRILHYPAGRRAQGALILLAWLGDWPLLALAIATQLALLLPATAVVGAGSTASWLPHLVSLLAGAPWWALILTIYLAGMVYCVAHYLMLTLSERRDDSANLAFRLLERLEGRISDAHASKLMTEVSR